jgi:hypothetical protein
MSSAGVLVLVVLIGLGLAALISKRRARAVKTSDIEPITVDSYVAWFLIGSGLSLFTVILAIAFHDLISKPSNIPISAYFGEALFLGCTAMGLYLKTLKITVDDTTLSVSSFFGRRNTLLRDIGSVAVINNGQWRTMDVRDKRKKRILYITTTGLPRFDELADLLSAHLPTRVDR